MNNEDKLAWCKQGERQERAFVHNRLPQLGITGRINPAKIFNKYTHDLFLDLQSDLKTVETPLFMAREMFGLDPQYAVTFNVGDGKRYASLYPNIVVIFDVHWKVTSKTIGDRTFTVEPMHVTYAGLLSHVRKAIFNDGDQKIVYKNRVGDTEGNATESWVFDVRQLHQVKERQSA